MSTFHRHLPRVSATPALAPLALAAALACPAGVVAQTPQQVVKPPVAQAWIDVATGAGIGMPGMGGMGGGGGAMSMIGGAAWDVSMEPLADGAETTPAPTDWRVQVEWGGAPYELNVPAAAANEWLRARFPTLDI